METNAATTPAGSQTAPPPQFWRRFSFWAPVLALGLFWLTAFNHLRMEWTNNENYGYGWFVPFLAAYLIWERWQCRPAANRPRLRRVFGSLILIGSLAYIPWRVVREANPDWPLLGWPIGILAVVLTLYCVYAAGGWRWLRHFWFPIVFVLVAVPWPYRIEHVLTQGLMRVNASFAAEVLTICGIPALAHGNLVEVRDEVVDVDEACSGIRSMQTSVMMALFLGEFYRFGLHWRLGLLAFGIGLAFFTNLARTLTLAWLGSTGGSGLLDKWHDSIGLGILVFCVLGLWAVAAGIEALIKKRGPPPEAKAETPADAPLVPRPLPVPPAFALGLLLLFVFSELATETWYRLRAPEPPDLPLWSARPPEHLEGYRNAHVSPAVERIFNHSHGFLGNWGTDHYRWSMYYFFWEEGKNAVWATATHRPEHCLPASGITYRGFLGIDEVEVANARLPFLTSVFDLANGRELYAFHLVWVDDHGPRHTARDFGFRMRLRNAWEGDRNFDGEHQLLGVAVEGAFSREEAVEALAAQLPEIVIPERPSFPGEN